jgi:DNA polymerase-3 subunit alpha
LSEKDILMSEKELLGFYVSGHPLDREAVLVESYSTSPIRELNNLQDGDPVRYAGMLASYDCRFSKTSGKPFAILNLEDMDSSCEGMCYERTITKIKEAGVCTDAGSSVIIEGTISKRDESESPRLLVDMIYPLDKAPELFSEELYIHIYEEKVDTATVEELSKMLLATPGSVKVRICVVQKDDSVVFIEPGVSGISLNNITLSEIDRILGPGHYRIKSRPYTPKPKKKWTPKPAEGAEEKKEG